MDAVKIRNFVYRQEHLKYLTIQGSTYLNEINPILEFTDYTLAFTQQFAIHQAVRIKYNFFVKIGKTEHSRSNIKQAYARLCMSKVHNKIVKLNRHPQDSVSSSGTCVLISDARCYVLDSKLFLIIQPVFIVHKRFKRVTI